MSGSNFIHCMRAEAGNSGALILRKCEDAETCHKLGPICWGLKKKKSTRLIIDSRLSRDVPSHGLVTCPECVLVSMWFSALQQKMDGLEVRNSHPAVQTRHTALSQA